MITIVDYGMGNLHSVLKAFKRLQIPAEISSDPENIQNASQLLLPGVGNFKRGMYNLAQRNLIEPLNNAVVNNKVPVLGICLGMQLMTKHSEEGNVDGLGWIDANTMGFNFSSMNNSNLHIPHIGWNNINCASGNPLFANMESDPHFYFVHSYYVNCASPENVAGTTHYGNTFVSAISKNNIFATQFHPEKSHDIGLTLLKNFTELS